MSFDIDNVTGSIRKLGSEHVAASLSNRLLFPIPQSPSTANDEGFNVGLPTDELVRFYGEIRLCKHLIAIITKRTILNV
jgi:hypothetical protein